MLKDLWLSFEFVRPKKKIKRLPILQLKPEVAASGFVFFIALQRLIFSLNFRVKKQKKSIFKIGSTDTSEGGGRTVMLTYQEKPLFGA